MRLRLDVAYDGTHFHGWATQPGLRTVQGVVEEWIGQVLRLPAPPLVMAAGRTDAGVHARGQVCHVDLPAAVIETGLPARRRRTDVRALPGEAPDGFYDELLRRLRRALPADVVLRSVSPAPAGFDARFSAIWRRYCYRMLDATTPPDPLLRGHVVALRHAVDMEAFNTAAASLLGLRDFAPFCKPRAGATTIRDLKQLSAVRHADGLIEVHLLADAFCHSMVRSLVGALSAVAGGRRDLAWLHRVASQRARHGEVLVMPARGLTLEEVGYPPDQDLAARALASRAMRTLEDE